MKKEKDGYIIGIASTLLNIVLFVIKLWVGVLSGSVAMIADAWHTLSDTLTSIIFIIGLWVSRRPADKEHPYGHGRAELISSIVISTLLAFIGLHFFIVAIKKIISHDVAQFSQIAIIIFFISAIIKEGMAQISFYIAKKNNLQSLLADAYHHRSDAITSFLIVAGGLFANSFEWLDGVMAIIVAFLILKAAYDIFLDSANIIIGEDMPIELKSKIKMIVLEELGKDYIPHHFHIHNYQYHKEITFHVYCPQDESFFSLHKKIDKVEDQIEKQLNLNATVHPEPLTENLKSLDSEV